MCIDIKGLFLKLYTLLAVTFLSLSTYAGGLQCKNPSCRTYLVTSGVGDSAINLYVNDWGADKLDRPTLLLFHGFPHSHIEWQKQINSGLRNKYRLVTVDLRGFGNSDKPTTAYTPQLLAQDVNAIITTLGLNHTIIMAHSFSGRHFMDYIYYYGPSKVSGFICVACLTTVADDLTGGLTPAALNLVIGSTFPFPPGPSPEAFLQANKDFINLSYSPNPVPQGKFMDILTTDLSVTSELRFAMISTYTDFPGAQEFTNGLVTVQHIPTLIIAGQNDSIVDPNYIKELHNRITGSALIVYPNNGHFIPLTNKIEFNQDVDNFMKSIFGDDGVVLNDTDDGDD